MNSVPSRANLLLARCVVVHFDGRSGGKQTVKMLERNLVPLGLRVLLSVGDTIQGELLALCRRPGEYGENSNDESV